MINFFAHSILIMAVLTLFCPQIVTADSSSLNEYEIKAAYLYNFAKYVDWPLAVLPRENSPLTFCVIGQGPINAVTESLSKKTIKNRQLVIQQLGDIEDLSNCNILFINPVLKASLAKILAAAAHRSILTVSDIKGFAVAGGIIEFVPVDNKIRFAINNRAARQADLKISSHLLRLATTVTENSGK